MTANRLRTPIHSPMIHGFVLLACMSMLAGCGGKEAASAEKPAKTELVAHESELLRLTLTPQAETRLGIQTVAIGLASAADVREAHGEVVVPATGGGVPVSAQTDLAALAANQARADGDIARARALVLVAQKAAARAAALVVEEAGSVRGSDEAQSALAVAQADLRTAQAQRALLGAPIGALGGTGTLWIRVAVFVGDLPAIDRRGPVRIQGLGEGIELTAHPVSAPPSSNVAAGTVDLYYAISNRGGGLRVGQRVAVALPVRGSGSQSAPAVPASAILRDAYGGEWVYILTKPHSYERRRIEVATMQGGQAVLARGLAPGDRVVTAGAAELFGTEFGAK